MNDTTIAPATVVAVLLSDGWHRVVPGSFSVGALSFGAEAGPGTPGFRFEQAETGSPYRPATLAGPLRSIIAVRQVGSATRDPGELARPTARHRTRFAPPAAA
jgi:hypothetical protein